MLRIRLIEEAIASRYAEQQMRCPVHLSVGQEAAAVGVCMALRIDDLAFSTHRCHGHYLAKGGNLHAMIAELLGRATGCCSGRGGSMHLWDHAAGLVSSVPIVGGNIPLAVGAALASQQRGEDRISVAFLGDAAAEEGSFHESLNLAATLQLPVLFVLENNRYSVYTPLRQRQPPRPLTRLGQAHGIPTANADGSDVTTVFAAAAAFVASIREGQGPALLVIDTYRYLEHCGPNVDDDLGYRPPEEVLHWQQRCPVATLRERLIATGRLHAEQEAKARQDIEREIAAAFATASQDPFPDPATVAEHLYPPTDPAIFNACHA
ncbi:MAG: thiamine pyrophosphate-dependent dehydrogenase E1 component subunit alpha [Myxococcales bacterium FL481]|nr:MAG: thiamine pyrophosphate-dependent dehydrogenase E1 component subunit alpha [Myxococcales bacterium FL481]